MTEDKTTLISIASKPIKVVVVIVVIGLKQFWSKNNPKSIRPKIVGSKKSEVNQLKVFWVK